MSGRGRNGIKKNGNHIPTSDIKRLARRGGLKKISKPVVEKVRMILKIFLENVIRDVLVYVTKEKERRSVTERDVMLAISEQADFLYDFKFN